MEGLAELAGWPGGLPIIVLLVRGRHVFIEGWKQGGIGDTLVSSSASALTLLPLTRAGPAAPVGRRRRGRIT